MYNTNYDDTPLILNTVKKALREGDRDYIWREVLSHKSLAAFNRDMNWPKLWHDARDHEIQGPRSKLILSLQR